MRQVQSVHWNVDIIQWCPIAWIWDCQCLFSILNHRQARNGIRPDRILPASSTWRLRTILPWLRAAPPALAYLVAPRRVYLLYLAPWDYSRTCPLVRRLRIERCDSKSTGTKFAVEKPTLAGFTRPLDAL
jgi:hypothetical protein